MARFPGVDYLRIDSLFSEQELLVRETARRFVDERVAPLIVIVPAMRGSPKS